MSPKAGRSARNIDFTSGPIVKQLIQFTIPAFIGNVFSALYNVVDTIVVGQFVGSSALAAVSCSFAITMVCVSIYAGFGFGSSVLTAQTFGAKRFDRLNDTINTAYIGAFCVGTLMIVVGELVASPLLRLLNTPETIMKMASSYVRVYFLGSTGQIFYFMGSGMLRAMGDSKWPTYALVLCAVLNILLDLLFVVVFHWDCAGVAAATIIAQYISAILVLFRAYGGGYGIKFDRKTFRPDFIILKQIFKLGIPNSLQMLGTSIGTLILTRFANGFGEDVVATNGIVQKVEQFSLMPAMSMGTAVQMFVGQNMGAGEDKRCNEGIRKITILIIGLSLVVTAVCMGGARLLCRAFVSEEAVIAMGAEAIRLAALFYAFHALQVSLGGVLQGAAATRPIMYISFVGIAARVAMCYLFAVRTGHWQGLVWASNGFFVVVSVLYILYLWKGNWKRFVRVRKDAPAEVEAADAVAADAGLIEYGAPNACSIEDHKNGRKGC